jgi:hypothetical protein
MDRKLVEQWCLENDVQETGNRQFLKKSLTFSLLASVPVFMTGCVSDLPPEPTAFEECVYEMELTGVQLDCDDDEGDWYKKKGYKSKKAKSYYYSSSKSGYGSSGYSSGG